MQHKNLYINNDNKYLFVTIEQFATAIANAPMNTDFDFTFDTQESLCTNNDCGEPMGWYGVSVRRFFDEEDGVLCFGYYGGGCTQCVDMYIISDNTNDVPTNAKAIQQQLLEWFKFIPEDFNIKGTAGKVCVGLAEDNEEYFEEYDYFEDD